MVIKKYIEKEKKENADLNISARYVQIWNMLVAMLLVNTRNAIFFQIVIVNASLYSSLSLYLFV